MASQFSKQVGKTASRLFGDSQAESEEKKQARQNLPGEKEIKQDQNGEWYAENKVGAIWTSKNNCKVDWEGYFLDINDKYVLNKANGKIAWSSHPWYATTKDHFTWADNLDDVDDIDEGKSERHPFKWLHYVQAGMIRKWTKDKPELKGEQEHLVRKALSPPYKTNIREDLVNILAEYNFREKKNDDTRADYLNKERVRLNKKYEEDADDFGRNYHPFF